ncbi:MAG: ABC transporter permease [Bacteroidetes bacterium]|nr:ABC transporter permease [Bacteroidota bacterium]
MKSIRQFLKESIDFFYQLYVNRMLILNLSLRDFEKKYISNFFGFVWVILDPLAFVVILYLVFGSRYGSTNPEAVPFVVYLITGYIAYDFFSQTLRSITFCISDHSFLLKKVNFRVAVLPIVTVFSHLMVHGIVLVICFVILLVNHIYPQLFWFQLIYYIVALSVLMISLGWLTSSIFLFFPDISNIVGIIIQAMFFLTPIFWNMQGLPLSNQLILKLNPIFYIVNGYRESLTNHQGFWTHPVLTLYFWTFCLIVLVAGVTVFKKLRPHFADVATS